MALNPATPASAVAHVLDLVDLVLVMTVNPGFGGQAYIATMEPKIAEVRRMLDDAGSPTTSTWRSTAGSHRDHRRRGRGRGQRPRRRDALFRDPHGLEHAVSDLRARAEAARPSN